MLDAGRHPLIDIAAYSEVKKVSRRNGAFRVTIARKPRYVREDVCNACGDCTAKCPTKVPNAFNVGLNERPAIYLYFDQGIPAVMTIDRDHCRYFATGKCRVCEKVCTKGAIDFEQKERTQTLDVGAIVLATGLSLFDPTPLTHYGYGRIKNVITGLEYERLINATGPTGGHLLRRSDGALAHRVAYVQCAGSRDLNYCDYCSSVCCMYAIKDAMLGREHDPECMSYIFHTDLRNVGKWFQRYRIRGEDEYGIRFVRGRVAEVAEGEDDNPVVWYEDTETQEVASLEVELVVLATAALPSPDAKDLAGLLGIKTDKHGFVTTDDERPADTSARGVFACGFCKGPCDIPESVAQASAAASRASEHVLVGAAPKRARSPRGSTARARGRRRAVASGSARRKGGRTKQ
jgi:heterodisulfide reductase subunit A